jgi:hypothetical protein
MASDFAQLGDRARDRITGYKGIVVGKSQHITGCDRVTLQAETGADGKMPDCYSFDITTVEVLERGAVAPIPAPPQEQPKATVRPGGPLSRPPVRR